MFGSVSNCLPCRVTTTHRQSNANVSAEMQNKLLDAVTEKTVAEIIVSCADASPPCFTDR
jgi:hypothetical protein